MRPKPVKSRQAAEQRKHRFKELYRGWEIDFEYRPVMVVRPGTANSLWDGGYPSVEDAKRAIDEVENA